MTTTFEFVQPRIHGFATRCCSNSLLYSKGSSSFNDRCRVYRQNPNRFVSNSITLPLQKKQVTVLSKHERFNLWDGFSRKKSRLVVNCQEDDQKESSSEEEESSQSTPAKSGSSSKRKREKQREDKVWWSKGKKWQWQPIIQAQGIGVLLLQLGVVMFVMRLLRPGIPLPGSEPRIQTTFVSVPYSEFLSKVNSNQVQKVEVDGVQVLFKLRDDGKWQESESSRLSESSESLLRTVAPTKRVVYSTTRPGDIKTPYEKMLGNNVEFGSPEKRSGGFFNSGLVKPLVLQPYTTLYYLCYSLMMMLYNFAMNDVFARSFQNKGIHFHFCEHLCEKFLFLFVADSSFLHSGACRAYSIPS